MFSGLPYQPAPAGPALSALAPGRPRPGPGLALMKITKEPRMDTKNLPTDPLKTN